MIILNKWNDRFMGLAFHIAQWSRDPSTKVGAVIVDQGKRIISVGFNGFPRGVKDENLDNRELKYKKTIHAEMNAIHFANRNLEGSIIFVTHPTCAQCAANIIQAGIKEVVVPVPEESFMSRWGDDWKIALEMYEEANIKVVYHAG